MRLSHITTLFCALLMSACSTYVEEVASEQFMPVIPDKSEEERIVDGAIYTGKSNGLFATECKASKVGDIVTVALNESFNASKSQSAATGKTDSYGVTLPTGLINDLVGKSVKAADYGFGSTQAFNGTGTASQSNA